MAVTEVGVDEVCRTSQRQAKGQSRVKENAVSDIPEHAKVEDELTDRIGKVETGWGHRRMPRVWIERSVASKMSRESTLSTEG